MLGVGVLTLNCLRWFVKPDLGKNSSIEITPNNNSLTDQVHELCMAVVLNLFYPMHPFNRYSQINSPLKNLCEEHFYISNYTKKRN